MAFVWSRSGLILSHQSLTAPLIMVELWSCGSWCRRRGLAFLHYSRQARVLCGDTPNPKDWVIAAVICTLILRIRLKLYFIFADYFSFYGVK
jgi:hypothetical protein